MSIKIVINPKYNFGFATITTKALRIRKLVFELMIIVEILNSIYSYSIPSFVNWIALLPVNHESFAHIGFLRKIFTFKNNP